MASGSGEGPETPEEFMDSFLRYLTLFEPVTKEEEDYFASGLYMVAEWSVENLTLDEGGVLAGLISDPSLKFESGLAASMALEIAAMVAP